MQKDYLPVISHARVRKKKREFLVLAICQEPKTTHIRKEAQAPTSSPSLSTQVQQLWGAVTGAHLVHTYLIHPPPPVSTLGSSITAAHIPLPCLHDSPPLSQLPRPRSQNIRVEREVDHIARRDGVSLHRQANPPRHGVQEPKNATTTAALAPPHP